LISTPRNWLILCKVIDNFGDVGVTWRLAKQLALEQHAQVEYWIDDLSRAKTIGVESKKLGKGSVTVREWSQPIPASRSECFNGAGLHAMEVVIAAFACETPDALIHEMQLAQGHHDRRVLWINLEYLSAEAWIEGSHLLSSPRQGLAETFYFPGWSEQSGGLIREAKLETAPCKSIAARESLLERLQVRASLADREDQLLQVPWVSVFSYPHAPIGQLIELLRDKGDPALLLIPSGVASKALARLELFAHPKALCGANEQECAWFQLGPITVVRIPFVAQEDFDDLLDQCDLNLIRGEDSLVRAIWANAPLLWHIYPQDEEAHKVKLQAFLDRVVSTPGQATPSSQGELMQWWNGQTAHLAPQAKKYLFDALSEGRADSQWRQEAENLRTRLACQTDLLTRLLNFATHKQRRAA
jgi:uncharacterized repeat protein (TIGR03837 family)